MPRSVASCASISILAATAVTSVGCDAGLAPTGSGRDSSTDAAPGAGADVGVDAAPDAIADDLGCASEAADAMVGTCRLPLPNSGGTFDCAASWGEQRLRSCKPGVVVFVSADSAPAGQLIWFERPWFSGGTSCFYAPTTEMLVGSWYVSDNPIHCCRTSFDVTYGAFDVAANEAAVRAAQPWVGRLFETSGTEIVDGGEVRYCASVKDVAPAASASR